MRSDVVKSGIPAAPNRSLLYALGYTKEMITNLPNMPFSIKSLEKRQGDLIARLFPPSEQRGVNVTRLVVRAIELNLINIENLEADE